ncbi:MAG TPA: alkaline phosphatase family protein, partial [Acidimicrobiales bacterium]|nr:alkaline phosphatase family protein [Acidimicrobiales bacterium]
YAESMPSNCDPSNASTPDGVYYARHNPAVYFTAVQSACASRDVPMGTVRSGALHDDVAHGTLPVFSTVTPNGTNDGHDSDVATADAWLGPWIAEITAGPDYRAGRLTVEIVWDEGEDESQQIPSVWLSAYIRPGATSGAGFTHYSTLRAAEEIAGVPLLGRAATAADPRAAFGF